MFGLGTTEIIVVAVIFVFIFGSSRIPKISKDIVDAIKNLRKATEEIEGGSDAKVED